MYRQNEALLFHNTDKSFKIMIRPSFPDVEQEEQTLMQFDLLIVYEESEDLHGKFFDILTFEYSGFMEDGDFTLDSLEIPKDETADGEHVAEAIRSIESVYAMTICDCYKYFKKDTDFDLCLFCQLTMPPSNPEEEEQAVCVICQEPVYPTTQGIQKCCKQVMHPKCLEMWLLPRPTRACPVCRSESM